MGLLRLAKRTVRRTATQTALADHELRAAIDAGELRVTPFDEAMIRPAALSLRLGTTAYVLRSAGAVDTADPDTYPKLLPLVRDERGRFTIGPDDVVLAPTLERVTVPTTMVGIVDGISDMARLGLSVVLSHQVSPGFGAPDGAVLTLEIVSRLEHPVHLYPGTRVCNLMLLRCAQPERPHHLRPHNHSAERDAGPSLLAAYVPSEP